MARHSKNNTASSVFTYGEKQKLKEYGTAKQRIGLDSQRKFEMCHLCLYKVQSPMCCDKGHIFCRNCLIEYLATEKLRLKRLYDEYQEKSQAETLGKLAAESKKTADFIENYDRVATGVIFRKKSQDSVEEDAEIVEKIKSSQLDARNLGKKQLIKENFWVPETHEAPEIAGNPRPTQEILCPGAQSHALRLKKCYKVVFCEDNEKNFVCFSCRKELKFQKVLMGKRCGHAFCKSCMEKLCLKDGKCAECGNSVRKDQVIAILEGFTAFATHNAVEAEKYQPAFVG